ncbi:MAG: mutM [Candidatus Magasanikbacteria bacterium]|nr:mutM [Candidatus Magasanikbacteria bacterium]
MPELPEVETIRRQLQKEIVGATIRGVIVNFRKRLNVSSEKFRTMLKGKKILAVGRRAKLLVFELSNGLRMLGHLKMTGRFLIVKKGTSPNKHTHIQFILSGKNDLYFEDYRKFGFLKLMDDAGLQKELAAQNYGPEPLTAAFSFKKFVECIRGRGRKKIKQVLMEQTCIAGIGNIYADEICFAAGVHPERPANRLSAAELKIMFTAAKKILTAAIKNRGTSADAYLDAHGQQGTYVPFLKVYDRDGEKCRRNDGGIIKKIRVGGRGTHFCPKCQK